MQVRHPGTYPAHAGQRLDPPGDRKTLPQSQPVSAIRKSPVKEPNRHVCNFFIRIKCRTVALALCFSATGMDTSSCTARRGPSAWLTWQEATCTGSMSAGPCFPWAQCCSAPAASFLPFTGQTPTSCNCELLPAVSSSPPPPFSSVSSPVLCCAERWSRRSRRSSRLSVSRT